MKFRQIASGTRARKSLEIELLQGAAPLLVDVRPLTTAEEIDALARARAYAVEHGLPDPKEGQPVYDLAVMAHVLLLAAVDHDSPAEAPAPFFDAIEQPLSLDRDALQLLYEGQVAWQEECSPRKTELTPGEYAGLVMRLAEGDGSADDPFLRRLPRAVLVSCMRTMASQLLGSPPLRSLSSSATSPAGETEKTDDAGVVR